MRYEDINIGDKVIANGWRNDGVDHEYGTNSAIEQWVSEATTLVVKDLYSSDAGFEVSDGDRTFALHHSELSPAIEDERATLRPGDYVSTEGMTEETYHAVARAFMEAGGEPGTPMGHTRLEVYLLFDAIDNELWNVFDVGGYSGAKRHLTPAQVIGAVNAGNQQEETDTLTQTLRDAAEHDATAKHHAAEHDRLMQQAREMLPDGWRLVRDVEPEEDMTDPANWREGDVLIAIEDGIDITDGNKYIARIDEDGDAGYIDDGGDLRYCLNKVRFHSRPT